MIVMHLVNAEIARAYRIEGRCVTDQGAILPAGTVIVCYPTERRVVLPAAFDALYMELPVVCHPATPARDREVA